MEKAFERFLDPNEFQEVIPGGGEAKSIVSLSSSIYGVDWGAYFPSPLLREWKAELSHFDTIKKFLGTHYTEIFGITAGDSFPLEPFTPQKESYYRRCGDFFELWCGPKLAGVFVGTPLDWSSYYLRSAAILPEFQGQGVWKMFLERLLAILKEHRVARVFGEVVPSNHRQIHVFNELKFLITGFQASERWGTVIQFVKFLDPLQRQQFLKQFCPGGSAPPARTEGKEEL